MTDPMEAVGSAIREKFTAMLDIMADVECALVLTSEHSPAATVASFVDSSTQFKRLADFLRSVQLDDATEESA